MKDQIKAWLKQYQRDRNWLASQVFVTRKTVDNWLSSPKNIPADKLALIQRLIEDDKAVDLRRAELAAPVNQIFSLEVSLAKFRRYSAAALQQQQTLEAWAIAELDKAAAENHTAQGLALRITPLEIPPGLRLNESAVPAAERLS